uniref:E2 ubiquitin-conjugating enzyme n=1 Tax=Megaviridae environmental sample TaxID=1737588 RepID=A0A5J6VME1_9VIRU|nr:MAG: ubiquitin-conjugating enzyme [Megaviridae environmental sample]
MTAMFEQFTCNFDDKNITCRYNDSSSYCVSNDLSVGMINIINLYLVDKFEYEDIISTIKSILSEKENVLPDKYNLFNVKKRNLKDNINYSKLDENYRFIMSELNQKVEDTEYSSEFKKMKDLLWKPDRVYKYILDEIYEINTDMSYKHSISFDNDNPFILILKFKYDGELGEKLKILKKNHNYDWIQLKIQIDPFLFPFKVPIILQECKPNIGTDLLTSVLNNDIWNQKNWNCMLTFEWLLLNLGKALEPLFLECIDTSYGENIGNSVETHKCYSDYQLNLIKLQNVSKLCTCHYNIELDYLKFNFDNQNKSQYWSNGTGYGYNSNTSEWNVQQYLESVNTIQTDKIKIVDNIVKSLEEVESLDNILLDYISNEFNGLNMLCFTEKLEYYSVHTNLLKNICSKFFDTLPEQFKINFFEMNKDLYYEIIDIISNSFDKLTSELGMLFDMYVDTIKMFDIHFYIKSKNKNKEFNDTKEIYEEMIKKESFGTFDINNKHLFSNFENKRISQKTIIRIMSEISSLKRNLPVSWDSSIVFRTSNKINFISFIVTGPKDTPYHNGIFEFHGYFPDNYPNVVPQVLLETTNGGQFRFNPNLYASGKVCLSLLGTWSGQKGESWQPSISTFLQVLISIQSLIFVKDPYFNEPGYEKTMHTNNGITANTKYSENIRLHTMKIAIINKIKNNKEGDPYYNLIREHFKLKKDEIYEVTNTWLKEAKHKFAEMEATRHELIHVIEKLCNNESSKLCTNESSKLNCVSSKYKFPES